MIGNHKLKSDEQEKYAARKRTESRRSWKPVGDARRKFPCEPLAESAKAQVGDAGIPAVTRGSRSTAKGRPSELSDPLRRIN